MGKNGANFAKTVKYLSEEFSNSSEQVLLKLLVLNDLYLTGYAYAVQFDNDIDRYFVAMLALKNQVQNPLGVVNLESDLLSLFLVDNEVEKKNVVAMTTKLAQLCINSKLTNKFKVYTSVEQLDSAGLGVLVLTLDELPEFLEKFESLASKRVNALQEYLNVTKQILEKNAGRDVKINDQSIAPELTQQLKNIAAKENLHFLLPYEQFTNHTDLSVYTLHAKAQSLYDYFTEHSTSYETTHIVCDTDKDGNDIEVGEKVYKYTSAALGLVYVFNGYLYNEPKYYASRRNLLSFLRALSPQTLFWADQFRQEQRINLEDFTSLVVRTANVKMFELFPPYFLEISLLGGNNDKVIFDPLKYLQDSRNFVAGNGLTYTQYSELRLTPSKHLSKLKDINSQFLVALSFALQQRLVLVVANDREQTIAKLEEICTKVPDLNTIKNYLSVVAVKDLPFYRTRNEVAVILEDVELTRNLLSDLACIIESPNYSHSSLIIFGTGDTVERRASSDEEGELRKVNPENYTNVDKQREVIVDFLRDRRIVRRNNLAQDVNFYYTPSLSNTDITSGAYFDLQEQRNWNSQLSSDKFLTVRLNNREISYYPNLNGNLMVLAGINRNYFRSPISTFSSFERPYASYQAEGAFVPYHLNLNSGDLITNVSIAIHRVINLFTNREQRISKMRDVVAYWIVSDSQAELIPLYEKLFSNIFNKETNAKVAVKILANEVDPKADSDSLYAYSQVNLNLINQKESYNNLIEVVNKVRNKVLSKVLEDSYQKDSIAGLSEKDSSLVDDLLVNDVDREIVRTIKYLRALEEKDPESLPESFKQALEFYKSNCRYQGVTELYLMTFSEYTKYCQQTSPDLIVVENSYDLYRDDTAADYANFIRHLLIKRKSSVVLVSSPESTAEELFITIDSFEYRVSNSQLIYDLPTSERYAYGVNFKREDFKAPEYSEFKATEYLEHKDSLVSYIRDKIQSLQNHTQIVSLEAFNLPLTPYALPNIANPDYYIKDKGQLPPERKYGYVPALGEKEVEIYFNYLNLTKSKVLNAALSLLLQPRNNKSRGLIVVNNPEIKAYLEVLASEFSFVVHDFESIALERAVFSHAVIIADHEVYLQQAIIQHVSLLTRGFKTTGSIFLFADMERQKDVLRIIAHDNPFELGGHLFGIYQVNTTKGDAKFTASKMFRHDFYSPYFYLDRSTDSLSFEPRVMLPGKMHFMSKDRDRDPEVFNNALNMFSSILSAGFEQNNFTHGSSKKRNRKKKK
ncbi:hypothetical protein CKF59_04065 [Psittacicella gerlachiana]|uniref:Uncharacterized protein n=1 Tax=Psittacicella gerlachiana TaxID=2028574 RepID=A0A3A1YCM8_9GAMM|nr:hypothetical protein CKF59_04065 [Psittacicella gerlachiana]